MVSVTVPSSQVLVLPVSDGSQTQPGGSFERQPRLATRCLEGNESMNLVSTGEVFRDWFAQADFGEIRAVPNHTHGQSAATRTVGSNFARVVSAMAGEVPVMYQGSASNRRAGLAMSRDWYWGKDLSVEMQPLPSMTVEQPLVMIDVDYYVDNWEHRLATDFRPYLLFTFVPSAAARNGGDYSYRFHPNGEVEYVVSGGASYRHMVWDYGTDCLKVTTWAWDCGVIPLIYPVTAYYKVERRVVDADHQVVLLAPMKQWTGVFALLADSYLDATPLTHLNPVVGDFVRLHVVGTEGAYYSTVKLGLWDATTVPVAVDEEISLKSMLFKHDLTVAMTKSSMNPGGTSTTSGAETLTAFHRAGSTKTARVFSPGENTRGYQFCPKLADFEPDAKPGMTSFMKPLVDGCFVPDVTRTAEERSIKKRITEVASDAKVTVKVVERVERFVNIFTKDLESPLQPVDYEEVLFRQSRPSQRAILERADFTVETQDALAFIKRDPGVDIYDPRTITTLDGPVKREYSQILYALNDWMKQWDCYAGGKTPAGVAARVAAVCEAARLWVLISDFSRMDGRVSEPARYLERKLMTALFGPNDVPRILDLMRKNTFLQVCTKFGIRYNSEVARASGSPETSAFNSILQIFIIWNAFVDMGFNDEQSMYRVGEVMGDDGINADLDEECFKRSAAMMGQWVKCEKITHGHVVSFLSRFYGPEVWYGEPDSCCDLKRQLTKFHATINVPLGPDGNTIKLREKAFAFWLTDENTPVLGPFVKKVLEYSPVSHTPTEGVNEFKNVLNIWNAVYPKEFQYPSKPDVTGWKLELLEKQLPDFSVSRFAEWLNESKSISFLMDPPEPIRLIPTPDAEDAIVVDDDVLPPAPRAVAPTPVVGRTARQPANKRRGQAHRGKGRAETQTPTRQTSSSSSQSATLSRPRGKRSGERTRPKKSQS